MRRKSVHMAAHPCLSAIFLDAAGTLIHLREPVGTSYARVALRHGVQVEGPALERAFRQQWKLLPTPVHPDGQPPADDDRAWWRTLVLRTFQSALEASARPEAENQVQSQTAATLQHSGTRPEPDPAHPHHQTAALQEQPASSFKPHAPSLPMPSPETFDALFADLYEHFAQPHAWALYPDVLPALDQLRAHAPLHILSNFDRRLHRVLSGHHILEKFDSVILSSEVGASKPHPRIFRAALTAAGSPPPATCLHVGDDPRLDHQGALTAGLQAVLVNRPQTTLLTIAAELAAGR